MTGSGLCVWGLEVEVGTGADRPSEALCLALALGLGDKGRPTGSPLGNKQQRKITAHFKIFVPMFRNLKGFSHPAAHERWIVLETQWITPSLFISDCFWTGTSLSHLRKIWAGQISHLYLEVSTSIPSAPPSLCWSEVTNTVSCEKLCRPLEKLVY